MPELAALPPFGWLALTVAVYVAARLLHRRIGAWWTSPVLLAWAAMLALLLALHVTYHRYLEGGHWLVLLLGPATVAFAVPIHRQRGLIRRNWRVIAIGVTAGSLLSIGTSWALAALLHLPPELRASLLPRSISTPFAIVMARDIGGLPALTASFTVMTGLIGGMLAGPLLGALRLSTGFARGFLLGMGAHGIGTARAWQIGAEEGSIAGTVMILAGLANVALGALWLTVA
jgi:putative effector of murein hydrolase